MYKLSIFHWYIGTFLHLLKSLSKLCSKKHCLTNHKHKPKPTNKEYAMPTIKVKAVGLKQNINTQTQKLNHIHHAPIIVQQGLTIPCPVKIYVLFITPMMA